MSEFKALEKLVYIAKNGISLTFYCRCGDAVGSGNCPRCKADNKAIRKKKEEKAKYLHGFKIKW